MIRTTMRCIAFVTVLLAATPLGFLAAQQQAPVPQAGGGANPRRQMLEQRLRERTGELVKRRLQLTDDQMTRLQSTNRQFEEQRTQLLTKEREVRRELRQQLTGGTADQNRVSALLDQAMQLERQRLDVTQSEQRELAKYLTPVQRAKLFGLQNEMRRRAQELRNRPMQGPGGMQGQGQLQRPRPRMRDPMRR